MRENTGYFELARFGEQVLQDYKSIKSERNKGKVAEWVRYGITTLIAIAALVAAIISIKMQLSP